MRYVGLLVLVGGMLGISCGATPAECVRSGCRVQNAAVAVVQAQPLLIAVPSYGAGYAAQPTSSNDVAILAAKIDTLAAKIDALVAALNGQPVQPPVPAPQPAPVPPAPAPAPVPPPPPPPPAPPNADVAFATVMAGKCIACHESSVAKAKGGDVAFFTGNSMRLLTDHEKLRVLKRVQSNEMPKGKPLTDPEFGEFEAKLLATVNK